MTYNLASEFNDILRTPNQVRYSSRPRLLYITKLSIFGETMADLSWLRFGQRSRTPGIPKSPTTSERASVHEPEEHRRHMPSRVSSYLSLNSRFSFSPEPPTPITSQSILVKYQDKVWHNPNLVQMVEALQVMMMTRGVSNPIPAEYNSYVLHLIEAFHGTHEKLEKASSACEEAMQARSLAVEDFRMVADEWERRETQYKAEVKRLEVLLARTSRDGLETVTLARTGSVVDRDGLNPKQFVSRLKELRKQALQTESSPQPDTHDDGPVFFGQVPSPEANVLKMLQQIDSKHTDRNLTASRIPRIQGRRQLPQGFF